MANVIETATKYTAVLDEVYADAALTAILESDASLARDGVNAGEIAIPKISMDGLADYSRNSGYVGGDVDLSYETVTFDYDRGRSFTVDNMDNEETQDVAFGTLAGEFERTQIVPEVDAVRFAKYSQLAGTTVDADLANGTAVLAAVLAANSAMDEDSVPMENRHLFITPTHFNAIKALDTTKSREALDAFASIVKVPQSRFYSKVTLADGTTTGQETGGFAKAVDGVNLNFLIVHKPAVLQYTKHNPVKVITPEINQDADAWKYGVRIYALCDVYENKVAGVYAHTVAVVS
jgi:hypothetical protein